MGLNLFFTTGIVISIVAVILMIVFAILFVFYKKDLNRKLEEDYGDWRDINAK